MSGSNHGKGFRLRLFDDSGMSREQRNNLYWVIWSVTIGMLGTIVTTGPSVERFPTSGAGRERLSAGPFGRHSRCGRLYYKSS